MDAKRDWGHAKDYVEAMWLILQQDVPEDYVIATGVTTSVRDFVIKAFRQVGIELEFKGKNEKEIGVVVESNHPDYQVEIGKVVVAVDPRYYRPTEVDLLIGDPRKSQTQLGWKPKYDLDALIEEMVEHDVDLFKREKLLHESGFTIKNQYE
jgi:GDPmannose 4,6-dehydratase